MGALFQHHALAASWSDEFDRRAPVEPNAVSPDLDEALERLQQLVPQLTASQRAKLLSSLSALVALNNEIRQELRAGLRSGD